LLLQNVAPFAFTLSQRESGTGPQEELQFHLQNQTDEYIAKGMDAEEARHSALRSFGGVEQVKDARRTKLIDDFMQDASRAVTRLAPDNNWDHHRVRPDAPSRRSPVSSKPAKPAGLRHGICGDDTCFDRSMFLARLARNAN